MAQITRRTFIFATAGAALAAGVVGATIAPGPADARKSAYYTGLVKGVAVGGYDPVAYFKVGKPVKGRGDLSHRHGGVMWRFSSEENRKAFIANPAKYTPQFGGYCAWAVSRGYTAKGSPHAWSIFNGRLYLNYNKAVRSQWSRDKAGNVAKGRANWPKVLSN